MFHRLVSIRLIEEFRLSHDYGGGVATKVLDADEFLC